MPRVKDQKDAVLRNYGERASMSRDEAFKLFAHLLDPSARSTETVTARIITILDSLSSGSLNEAWVKEAGDKEAAGKLASHLSGSLGVLRVPSGGMTSNCSFVVWRRLNSEPLITGFRQGSSL